MISRSRFELEAQIEEHQYLVEDYRKRSVHAKAAASRRRAEIADLVRREQEGRAKAGNTASKAVLKDAKALSRVVDSRVSNDVVWRGYVDDNQFYDRQAKLEAEYVQTLQAALTRIPSA